MRTVLARQERMGPHEMGWSDLSRQTSTAVRKLWPQLTATLSLVSDGLDRVKSETISSGGMEVCELRFRSWGGIVMERYAVRAVEKKLSAPRPEQVPWVCHSCSSRPWSG